MQTNMRKVFVSHPLSGNVEGNITSALRWVRLALLEGHIPFAPYIPYARALDDSDEDERWIGMRRGLEVLIVCDELWVCGDDITTGMGEEIYRAQTYNIPIRYRGSDEVAEIRLPENA